MSKWYKLKHRKPVLFNAQIDDDMEEFAKESKRFFTNYNRKIRLTRLDGCHVSTVFLGLNHAWREGELLVFETMIFGGDNDSFTYRCATHRQALKQHWDAVKIAKFRIKEDSE